MAIGQERRTKKTSCGNGAIVALWWLKPILNSAPDIAFTMAEAVEDREQIAVFVHVCAAPEFEIGDPARHLGVGKGAMKRLPPFVQPQYLSSHKS